MNASRHDPETSSPVVVAFDVDKTLTQRDCVVPYLRSLWHWRVVLRSLRWSAPLTLAALRRNRDDVKSLVTRIVMTGLDRTRIEESGQVHAARVLETWMRPDTVARLQWHREQGHDVVLVSASYSSYLTHIAAHLGCRAVLACEVAFDASGRCTGELVGGNCRGPEKRRRLAEWMEGAGIGHAVTVAYGDSAGDDAMLAMATWPTRVDRRPLAPLPEFWTELERIGT